MAQGKKPPAALLKDMQTLFDKHEWPGSVVGRPAKMAGATECPDGQTPHDVTYQDANGNWVTTTVCL
jgi:hypothetical protein